MPMTATIRPYSWTDHFQLVLPVDLPYQIKHELIRACMTSPDREICGLITNANRIVFIKNSHPRPGENFAMDDVDFRRQVELIIAGDEEPVGCFHSHPGGSSTPSKGDLDGWPDDELGWRYFIITINGVFEWAKK